MPRFQIRSVFFLLAAGCGLQISTLGGSTPATAAPPEPPPQVAQINALIEQGWKDYDVRPSAEVEDSVWCRRVYLDLLGRIPTFSELAEFSRDRKAGNRQRLVDKLLFDEKYNEEYARNWATKWTNILIGRSGGGDAQRDFTSRDGMQKYLRDSFATNKAYNRMVYELVTATGSNKPGTENFNGAVNFLIDKVNQDGGVLATSSTSRIFLGLQVQCTQCHNHPFNKWKQQTFWEFNAFFRQSSAKRRFTPGTRDISYTELVDQDYAGQAGDADDAIIFYELRNGMTKSAYPAFMEQPPIDPRGRVDDVNRRRELARYMMDSEFLDRMIVNRMWSQFLGYGFTKPVDDLGPHNPPSHPELLDQLATQFREHSYDLKELMRWIVLSKPYQLSANITPYNELDDPAVGETPKFSHFYLRQMQAEELYQSLIVAGRTKARGSYAEQERERRKWLDQFVVAFATDEGDEATTFNGSIPQALMLFNGELIKRATSTEPGSLLSDLATANSRMPEKVTQLYLAGLARRPSRDEMMIASQLLMAREGNQAEALKDLWWAILNSNEFILQH